MSSQCHFHLEDVTLSGVMTAEGLRKSSHLMPQPWGAATQGFRTRMELNENSYVHHDWGWEVGALGGILLWLVQVLQERKLALDGISRNGIEMGIRSVLKKYKLFERWNFVSFISGLLHHPSVRDARIQKTCQSTLNSVTGCSK